MRESVVARVLLGSAMICLVLCNASLVHGRPVLSKHGQPQRSVGDFVGRDGRFDLAALRQSAYEGPLSHYGFSPTIDSISGEPSFLAAPPVDASEHSGDEVWSNDASPSVAGVGGTVLAVAVYNGRLIVGGGFKTAGNVLANSVAAWDGASWSSLGSGIEGSQAYVGALTVYDGRLIVGGSFTTAGGVAAKNIASWDGTTWSSLGSGMIFWVWSLTVFNGKLIAGGDFTSAGGVPASGIASWDGTSWSALGSGMGKEGSYPIVYALTTYSGKLIAAGDFTSAGGVAVNRIAAWDGNVWSALGSGCNAAVYTLTTFNTQLIAGGDFTSAGGVSANYIAAWNGSSWSSLGSGMNQYGAVEALTQYNGYLVAGGYFQYAGGSWIRYLAVWDGTGWSSLGWEPDYNVYALAVFGDDLIAGGAFTSVGPVGASSIASYRSGSGWTSLGSGTNDFISCLTVYNGKLIAGGAFVSIGGVRANHIAAWDGAAWSALGSGTDHYVNALTVWNGKLIAGGFFFFAGDQVVSNIASWDGSSWSGLGSGMNGSVQALAVQGEQLVAGGYFTTAGGTAANYIAAWNGSSWSPLGSGMNGSVGTIAEFDGGLVAGGYFTTAGGAAANYVAAWDGSNWSSLSVGMNSSVGALAQFDGKLVAAGNFTTAGGAGANYVAAWDGSAWSPLGTGTDRTVTALALYGGKLVATGYFHQAGGEPANYIAVWDGTAWSPLGSGMNQAVYTAKAFGGQLVAGGDFDIAGGKVSAYLATWSLGPIVPVVLVHGWTSTGTVWGDGIGNDDMVGWLKADGVKYVWPAYLQPCGTAEEENFKTDPALMFKGNAKLLADYIDAELILMPDADRARVTEIDIVAHSMGGLVSRRYIRNFPGDDWSAIPVRKLIMLGTPNTGSELAGKTSKQLCPLGPAGEEMDEGYMRAFNNICREDPNTEYYAIWGTGSSGSCPADKLKGCSWYRRWRIRCDNDGIVSEYSVRGNTDGSDRYPCSWGVSLCHDELPNNSQLYHAYISPILKGLLGCGSPSPTSQALVSPPPQVCLAERDSTFGGPMSGQFAVETNQYIIVALNAEYASRSFQLTSPSGMTYDSSSQTADSVVGYYQDSTGALAFFIENAQPGNWHWSAEFPSSSAWNHFEISGTFANDVIVSSMQNLDVIEEGDSLKCQITVVDAGSPAAELSVKGALTAAPAPSDSIRFYDDGLHSDGAAGDGTYGAIVSHSSVRVMKIHATITGNTSLGTISRYVSFNAYWSTLCCQGTTGNVNAAGITDLSDLSMLIAYLTATPRPTLPCPDEANVNATGIIDLSDLSMLIAYLTATPRPVLPSCP